MKTFACAPSLVKPELKTFEEPKGPFVPFIPEVCMNVGIMDSEKEEVPTLFKFITAQSTDPECRPAFA